MELRISGVVKESIVDGPGLRYTVFTQGCKHNCPGCHNPQTHDCRGGSLTDTDTLYGEIMKNPLLQGVTFSGGEPFLQPKPLTKLAVQVKAAGLDVVSYTGYTYEDLLELANRDKSVKEFLRCIDILIDGPFVLAQRRLDLAFRGSTNQRLIDVPASMQAGRVILVKSGSGSAKMAG